MSLQLRLARMRQLLAEIEKSHAPAALASSFGAEDMVLLDLIAREGLGIGVFTLDTGRLPRETHDLMARVRRLYRIDIEVFAPWPDSVEAHVREYGSDGFYDGLAQRKACCAVRKNEPLERALRGKRAWITGLRRGQSEARAVLEEVERDEVRRLWKFNPLAEWTAGDVWAYLRANNVPYNALHDRGYASIGCDPCTRAVRPGEHPRAGRWWWEQPGSPRECGLHEIPVRVAA